MRLIELTSDYEMKPFDCGDAALNDIMANNKWFMWRKLWQYLKSSPVLGELPEGVRGYFFFRGICPSVTDPSVSASLRQLP